VERSARRVSEMMVLKAKVEKRLMKQRAPAAADVR